MAARAARHGGACSLDADAGGGTVLEGRAPKPELR